MSDSFAVHVHARIVVGEAFMRALQANLVIFLNKLPKLLPEHEGEYALVWNGDVSIFQTADEATEAAMARCGDVTKFLVTKIQAPEASAFRMYT